MVEGGGTAVSRQGEAERLAGEPAAEFHLSEVKLAPISYVVGRVVKEGSGDRALEEGVGKENVFGEVEPGIE